MDRGYWKMTLIESVRLEVPAIESLPSGGVVQGSDVEPVRVLRENPSLLIWVHC